MVALVDADSLLYKTGFAFEDKTDWNSLAVLVGKAVDPDISKTTDVLGAKNAIDALIENIKFKTGCDEVELWLSGGNNFRYDVLPTYKSNRASYEKPLAYGELWEYLITKYSAKVTDGFEADDVVVYLKKTHPEDYLLCAIDKDVLKQTVGAHYNYGTDEIVETSKEEAVRFFFFQVLKGDPVDGYKGCPSIGDKRANVILDKVAE